MKGLKKIALATAVAAAPFAAQAELKALDDTAMGNTTGQAGITIELAANVDIGEIAYHDDDGTDASSDGGFLAISDVTIGGAANPYSGAGGTAGALDDISLYIDIAGSSSDTLAGKGMGDSYLAGAAGTETDVSWMNSESFDLSDPTAPAYVGGSAAEDDMPSVSDGDLVISVRSTSGQPVDFGVSIGAVSLAKSTGTVGQLDQERRANGGSSTTLISNLDMTGLLGPIDIMIQEESDTMNVNAYFNAQGTLNADFVGTSLDFKLHNERGDDYNSLQITADGSDPANGGQLAYDTSFAHAQVDIGKTTNEAGDDALAFNVNNFSGDLDLTNITPGGIDAAGNPTTAESIGSLYLTDLRVDAAMTVYGH